MFRRMTRVLMLSSMAINLGWAKEKAKILVPAYVLHARTITVLIDPEAGVSVDDPQANRVAQKDVEAALLKWGRFEPVLGIQGADLIVVVRRGNGKLVNQTITDPPQNKRPGSVTTTDDSIAIGIQHGRQPQLSSTIPDASSDERSHTRTEVGSTTDSFLVYEGGVENPLEGVPAWRYSAKDALHRHDVPAVGEFRKALEETEKAVQKP